MQQIEQISIEKIQYNPRRRIRTDLGDLSPLKESMSKYGQLHPIILTSDYELLAGQRRLESAKQLGWKEIKAFIIDTSNNLEKFEIEVEENIARKDFTIQELERMLERKRELLERNFLLKLWNLIKRFLRWLKKKLFGDN